MRYLVPATSPIGIVIQGGMYNGVIRALQRLGLANINGESSIPLYILNVTYPLGREMNSFHFCKNKTAVLVVEEGQPEFIEQNLSTFLYRAKSSLSLFGKDTFPMAGEYTGQIMLESLTSFIKSTMPDILPGQIRSPNVSTYSKYQIYHKQCQYVLQAFVLAVRSGQFLLL